MRAYKSGTNCCFWRWTEVPTKYITRLHFVKLWRSSICVHWLNTADPEPYDHDHPVSFLSVIVRGWYKERRDGHIVKRKWFNFIRSSEKDCHTITEVAPNTVTVCFMWAPRGGSRKWGYHLPDGWMFWKEYNKKYKEKS